MSKCYEEFYELFKIPKIEYTSPGRTVDDEGEICDYYIEKEYPSIVPVFFELLNYYATSLGGETFAVEEVSEFTLCNTLREKMVNRVLELSKTADVSEEIQDIYDILEEYYGFEGDQEWAYQEVT